MAKVAVITGGARRIGREIALYLHRLGFDIALHYHSSVDSARELVEKLHGERAGSCQAFQADLQDHAQVGALAAQLLECYPAIDLLVNNASGFEATPIESCTVTQFDDMMTANMRAPYFLVQGVLPALTPAGASIVNILDVHAEQPLRDYNVYGAAKAALASLTRSLAVELAPAIRVNGVAPGAILWPENDDGYDEAMRERTVGSTPLKRLGEPLDIARTVAFLAKEAPFITGQVIVVDGGRGLVR